MRRKLRAAVYLRCSDLKQDTSVAEQRNECGQFVDRRKTAGTSAERQNIEIVREYVDDGISGDETEKRPGFLRMREDAQKGLFDIVLCWNQDRFGRFDSLDAGYWIYPFRKYGVRLLSITEGEVDWDDFTGRMMYAMRQEGKHEFLRSHSQNVLRGQVAAAKQGSWIGCVPYGYVITGTRKQKRLELGDPRNIGVVERIFDEFVNGGRTMRGIAERLNAENIVSPGGNRWRSDSVKTLLQNPVYVGTYRFNVSSRAKYNSYQSGEIKKGAARGRKDESDWIVIADHHPAIIDVGAFNKAQGRLAKGKTGQSPYAPDSNPYLLSGKLKCEKCGSTLHGFNNGKFRYYECGNRKYHGTKACPGTTVREDHVLMWFSDYLEDEFFLGGEIEANNLATAARRGELTEKDLPSSFAKLKRMFVQDMAPKVDPRRIEKRIASIDADIAKAKRNLILVDPKNIPTIEKAIREYESDRKDLVRQVMNQPKPQDVNEAVTAVLRSLVLLWRRDDASVRLAMREVDAITCDTMRTGERTRRRHLLHQVRFGFVGGVASKLNPYRSA